jgi:hypothetical protein
MAHEIRKYTASSTRLLAYVLEQPALVQAVRELDGASLGKLIEHIGLEDAGELIALTSLEQLEQVLDDDLWRASQLAEDERFDPRRFATWLAVMLELGDDFTVRRLCALPRDLLTLAVHRLVLVVDMDALISEQPDDGTQKALDSALHEEWEEFRVLARDSDAWEALWQALTALDQDHHELLRDVLERCAALDAEIVEEHGGLFEAIRATDVLDDDVSEDRKSRRSALGYVAPADARSFLALAAQRNPSQVRDPMTKAYFRGLSTHAPFRTSDEPRVRSKASLATATADVPALIALMQEAEVLGPRGSMPALPARSSNSTRTPRALFEAAMEALRDTNPRVFDERREELSYLANVLLAGLPERKLRPVEALHLAIVHCSRGLQRELKARRAKVDRASATHLLLEIPADVLFRIGSAPPSRRTQ